MNTSSNSPTSRREELKRLVGELLEVFIYVLAVLCSFLKPCSKQVAKIPSLGGGRGQIEGHSFLTTATSRLLSSDLLERIVEGAKGSTYKTRETHPARRADRGYWVPVMSMPSPGRNKFSDTKSSDIHWIQ